MFLQSCLCSQLNSTGFAVQCVSKFVIYPGVVTKNKVLEGAPYVDPPAGGEIRARGFIMVLVFAKGAGCKGKNCDKLIYFIVRVS
jgi:hypothetical protein